MTRNSGWTDRGEGRNLSHISSYETEIRLNPEARVEGKLHPSWKLMKRALEIVAEEHGGSVGEEIKDYFGRSRKVDFSLSTPQFPAGVGISVSRHNGQVRFLYDAYGVPGKVIDDLCDQVVQNYTALAVTQALETLNYDVELEESRTVTGKKKITVRGIM